jgi:hypothetical protein
MLIEGEHPVHRHFIGVPRAVIPYIEDESVPVAVLDSVDDNF